MATKAAAATAARALRIFAGRGRGRKSRVLFFEKAWRCRT